ncbi:MAG: Holliday junction DNA helicase RuvA [Candidatus Lambdaproteobacteria bacterium RIFOXYD1_FULL_56_27]|uniref:Holliday junction branch migration complex subunit RuvA n=1 Tax=Candidatus Lambdaproteobacteria bacterium RIFOXYD2_FULL_56_26 TaxID=1817773 RepID=A0A1F6GQ14_9PROT|nr:MAG: Holliday junction DNA helicase RuvA [Candidatus Lambdaproteobacteria bacterium RIFOXYD2_FULL_56_26]OGH03646.1 MAG: Holliday junction DNA helicase RuvA [Candidatus Lambdaproteobacteria bacterium RIFOXYC1_FULL_56_13]OGH07230.1 MAG: Holliday junction DNA helicase RuvA [Candidatus Lambdaproteobacteria bacterium RIFOXYD1_FULL_56_27]
MIGWIRGRVLEVWAQEALVETGGLGYTLEMGANQLLWMKAHQGQVVERHVYTVMREDGIRLFAFDSLAKRELFDKLLSVSGVGPKAAMSILDLLEPEQFISCILAQDERPFLQAPGIGKKIASRLLLELKDKFKHTEVLDLSPKSGTKAGAAQTQRMVLAEARSALVNLGFMEKEADKVLKKHLESSAGLDELIRLCLQDLKQ